MKNLTIIVAAMLLLAPAAGGQSRKGSRPAPARPAATVERTLEEMERQVAEAFKNKDVAALDRLLAADFLFTAAEGQVLDRAGFMDMVNKTTVESYGLDDLITRSYGDTGIVAGRRNGKFEIDRKKTAAVRFTDTFVRRMGRWQIVASQETPIGERDEQSAGEETIMESGLRYVDLVIGNGKSPRVGQTVTAHYTGWLEDGTKFDSSLDTGQPISFPIGVGRVIRGWDEGLMTMKVGGKRRLIIPPDLGYGARGAGGVIPPNAKLIFEVELLDVR